MGGNGGGLPRRLRGVAENRGRVTGLPRMMDQPSNINPTPMLAGAGLGPGHGGGAETRSNAGEDPQDPPIEVPASHGGQRTLDRAPQQLMPEPDRVLPRNEQPRPHRRLDCSRRRPVQQPQLRRRRHDRDQPHDIARIRRQRREARESQVADRQRHPGIGVRSEYFCDQQRVSAGQRPQPGRGPPRPPGQLGHRPLRQRLHVNPPHRLRRQQPDDRPQWMVDGKFVVAVRDNQQRLRLRDPPSEEHEQVQGRLVGPVRVLDYDDRRPVAALQLIEQRREQLLTRTAGGKQPREGTAGAPADVMQRPERPRSEQRIARTEQEPGPRGVMLAEPPHESRLADARLTRHEHDPPRPRRRGKGTGEIVEQRIAFEQVRHSVTVPRTRTPPPSPAPHHRHPRPTTGA